MFPTILSNILSIPALLVLKPLLVIRTQSCDPCSVAPCLNNPLIAKDTSFTTGSSPRTKWILSFLLMSTLSLNKWIRISTRTESFRVHIIFAASIKKEIGMDTSISCRVFKLSKIKSTFAVPGDCIIRSSLRKLDNIMSRGPPRDFL